MAKSTTTDYAKLAFWQLLEDDDVQKQLRTAATRLREAATRFSRLSGPEAAVEDEKLYDKAREAVTALARALKLLQPEPPPRKKRRGLQLLVLGATAGAVMLIARQSESATG